ncbi:MAG: exodeoxyribonuclease VII large subunit [Pseudomonadota bacterium]
MSDPQPDTQTNASEYSVSEISQAVKRTVEDRFGYVRVRGEISGFRGQHGSGHAYFALKDERARLEAVIWRGVYGRLKTKPEEGLEVIATGKITTYPGSSKYQIVIEALEPAGVGALMALLEERKKKLAAEGLFDEERKRALPFLPKVIGVVTSPTGAVIRDIVHRLKDRFPSQVLIWPVRVQGETSGAEVAAAIKGFNQADGLLFPKPDLLIVARGGGSLEDLWGFNDEAVVRAAAESRIPLISAIGHETDWTLIDFASDRRAPTPTGAAEMAVPVRHELIALVTDLGKRTYGAAARHMMTERNRLTGLTRALPSGDQLTALSRQRLDEASGRLPRAVSSLVSGWRARFAQAAARSSLAALSERMGRVRERLDALETRNAQAGKLRLERARGRLDQTALRLSPANVAERTRNYRERLDQLTDRSDRTVAVVLDRKRTDLDQARKLLELVSYQSVLGRGFALVRDDAGRPVKLAANVKTGSAYKVEFSDGLADMVSTGKSPAKRSETASRAEKPSPSKPAGKQGSLFD